MFDATWLNVGSLLFGLVAWIIPVVSFFGDRERGDRRRVVCAIGSFSACAFALCMQIMYSYHLVKIGDWSALMDTTGAVVTASIILIVITIVLNAYSVMFREKKAV